MRKLLPIIVFVLIAAAALFFVFRPKTAAPPSTSETASTQVASDQAGAPGAKLSDGAAPGGEGDEGDEGDAEEGVTEETRPASELYTSADQALEAVKKAAADYDDLVLEQFTRPGPDCTWCDQFYASVKELMNAPDTSTETKGYYAELLAVSGRTDNLQTLVDSIKNAKGSQDADTYAEALELATGGDDVVKFLGSQMDSNNEAVQEASIAAVTNQGTRLAAELLYDQTVKSGNPDGYYSRGIGLGEFIPDPEALSYLQGLVKKQDQYSPLAVKALVNSGMDGLKIVFDELKNSKDREFIKKCLADLQNHVNYEEGIEEYFQKQADSVGQPDLADFSKKTLEDFKSSVEEDNANANMSIDPSLAGGDAGGEDSGETE